MSKTLVKPITGTKSRVTKSIVDLLEEDAKDDLVIGPSMNKFLTGWNEVYPEPVVKRIGQLLQEGQRDRRYSFSASNAGRCKRRQEFGFLGAPSSGTYDPMLARIFLNGTWTHLKNQAVLMSAGILDNIEVTVKKPSLMARCTMDGMGVAQRGRYDGADFGYELKSANENSFNTQVRFGTNSKYFEKTRRQVDFQFLMTGFDIIVIFNENKNNQEVSEWVIVRDEDRVKAIREELVELNRAVNNHTLHPQLPECKKQLRSGEFYACPYGGKGGVCAQTGTWPNRMW